MKPALCLLGALLAAAPSTAQFPELEAPVFHFREARGLGFQEGVCRRDPSDVIRAGGVYYVWYTRVESTHKPALYPSGYAGEIWFATSRDGRLWQEQGRALGRGEPGEFDSHGVFTPNILVAEGKYYLFYTGVAPTPGRRDGVFENNSSNDFTAIGVAVSDSPDGPFRRAETNPVLRPDAAAEQFDSYRVDDACLIVRDGRYWLYFKGRSLADGPAGPRRTKMGVAIADKPGGPYVKHPGNPILDSGHEVLVWPHRRGVAALVSDTGPQARTIQYAADGLHFQKAGEIPEDFPKAPGAYRPDAFTDTGFGCGIRWGISMRLGPHPYLVRFDTDMAVPDKRCR